MAVNTGRQAGRKEGNGGEQSQGGFGFLSHVCELSVRTAVGTGPTKAEETGQLQFIQQMSVQSLLGIIGE